MARLLTGFILPAYPQFPDNEQGERTIASVLQRAIEALVMEYHTVDPHDPSDPTDDTSAYCVRAITTSGVSVVVLDRASHQEAVDYVTNDPDGLL